MLQTFRYRKHVRWAQYFVPAMQFAGSLLMASLAVFTLISLGDNAAPPFLMIPILLAALALMLLVSGIVLRYLFYRLSGIRVILDDDELIYEHRRGNKYIPYEDIVRVDSKSIRYTGGWLKIITEKDTIRLTVVLENIADFVQSLKRRLDELQLQHCYDHEKLFHFLKTATYCDGSWERIYEGFWRFLALATLWAITGFVIAVAAGGNLGLGVIAAILSAYFPLVPYYTSEYKFARQIGRGVNQDDFTCPARDKKWEKRTFRKALLLTALVYACIYTVLVLAARTFG